MRSAHHSAALVAAGLLLAANAAHANAVQLQQPIPCDQRHPMNDAWWTGPMLANTPATAPRGHSLIETYVYDVTTQGAYTTSGTRQSAPHANSYGTLTYLIYGLSDKTGFGLLPTAGYNTAAGEPSSAGPGFGDLTMLLQRRLTTFHPCGRMPIVSVAVEQTLPTGSYDQLARPTNGYGAGAWATNPELLSQMYFWLPNHRIVRTRLDLSDAFSHPVSVRDASVYGTSTGFRGTAHPGSSFNLDNSWEYSVTRSWVLAADLTYRNTGNTRVTGSYLQSPSRVTLNSGWSDAWGVAPAVEYSWKPYLGVLLGVRLFPAGHNTSDSITPAIAINFVH
ncbi:MAG TPA: hypothetical protein VGH38_16525 [Bryobacteraceae bacterium]|jgi:hypothetical protein